jgi:hypothetical protein
MLNAKILAAAITVATIATAPFAIAQEATAPATVSSSELDAFVVAYKDVVAIEQDYIIRVQEAGEGAERQAIISEAQAEMIKAVEEAPDIGVERYNEIIKLVQADPDLQADLTAKLQDN